MNLPRKRRQDERALIRIGVGDMKIEQTILIEHKHIVPVGHADIVMETVVDDPRKPKTPQMPTAEWGVGRRNGGIHQQVKQCKLVATEGDGTAV